MGRVRNTTIKRAAKQIVELYYTKLDTDFNHNKLVASKVADIQSKRLRNKIAGYCTVLMKRIQKGSVKGVYIKKHEEERERQQAFIPKHSVLDERVCAVDSVSMQMLKGYRVPGQFKVEPVVRK